jgi:hypothetical protein
MKRTWTIIGSLMWLAASNGINRSSVSRNQYLLMTISGKSSTRMGRSCFVSRLAEEPQTHPASGTREFALRDPDGYYVMVSALA